MKIYIYFEIKQKKNWESFNKKMIHRFNISKALKVNLQGLYINLRINTLCKIIHTQETLINQE